MGVWTTIEREWLSCRLSNCAPGPGRAPRAPIPTSGLSATVQGKCRDPSSPLKKVRLREVSVLPKDTQPVTGTAGSPSQACRAYLPRALSMDPNLHAGSQSLPWRSSQVFEWGGVVSGVPRYIQDAEASSSSLLVVARRDSLLLLGTHSRESSPAGRQDW